MKAAPLQISIPVYNEAENIRRVLKEIEENISTPHRTNIIYDFEEDNTIPAVKAFIKEQKTPNISLVKNNYSKGVLNAIKTGFDIAQEGAVLVVMADCSDDLTIVDKMYTKINQGDDIVCGSRYIKGGRQIGGPRLKGLLSRLAGTSLHRLTGIPTHDISNSFKMYRVSTVKEIKIESSGGFEIGMEILVKTYLKGGKISELPAVWRDRTAGTSRFQLRKWLPKYIHWYWYALKGRMRKNRTAG
jgi:dolichol-phosphate mannosyltransferase